MRRFQANFKLEKLLEPAIMAVFMRRKLHPVLALLLAVVVFHSRAETQDAQREVVAYKSGIWTFTGYIYKPAGKGPFPVVVWNHGHGTRLIKNGTAQFDEISKLYTRDGFVLF